MTDFVVMENNVKAFIGSALAAAFLSISPAWAAGQSADAQFRAIYASEWNWREAQFADDHEGTLPVVAYLPKVDPIPCCPPTWRYSPTM